MATGTWKPTLESLHTFLLLVEKREASAVAAALGVNESVVSRRLKELRERAGLLAKEGKGHRLTARGRQAVPAIRSLLQQYAHLTAWLAEHQARPRRFRVACGTLSAQGYLPQAIALFLRKHGDVQVQVQVRRGRERIEGTADGTYDLAIVSHDRQQIDATLGTASGEEGPLRVEDLSEQCLCLLARRGTPAAARLERILESQQVPVSVLVDLELIGLDSQSGIRKQLERTCTGEQRLRFIVEVGGWSAARESARHGLGVAIVPLSVLARDDRDLFVIRRLADTVRIKDYLIHRRSALTEEVETMSEAIRQSARAQQEELRKCWHGILVM
jgi:DNA-binding transcriptional LysR family regulator